MTPSAERLLRTATEVFYAEGIRATGIDSLVARAEVSKPTLYAHFGSKEGLIAAVLDRRSQTRREQLEEFLAQSGTTGEQRLLDVFDWLAEGHGRSGFRGCPFTNAAVELPDATHPARAVISNYKDWLRETLARLAAEAGLDDPDELGSDLQLLIDGANARVVVADDRTAIRRARSVAERLIGCARPSGRTPAPTQPSSGKRRTNATHP